jgi:chromate transporter
MQELHATPSPGDPAEISVSLTQLLLLFSRIGLTSFGGGLSAWLYREVVDRRRWLNEDEFLGALTMSQILPGSNVVNLSIYIGHRLRGALGSLIAVVALLLPPMIVAVLLSVLFQRLDNLGWLHDFLEGVAAAAIGLTASVGLRGARRALDGGLWPIPLILAVFITIGLLHWPLVPVTLVLAAASLTLAWSKR